MKKMILRAALYSASAVVLLAMGCSDNGVQTKSQKVGDFVNSFGNDKNRPDTYMVTVVSTGIGAAGAGQYPPYNMVSVAAGTPKNGYRFKEWTSSVSDLIFVPGANSSNVVFLMPPSAVTVTAVFEKVAETKKYTVTVSSEGTDAKGGGNYAPNDTVKVTSGTPPAGHQFNEWTSSVDGLEFIPSANNATAMFIMPDTEVTVTARFEKVSADAITITFNAGAGGQVNPASFATGANGILSYLPVPTKIGYEFTGWFTADDLNDVNATPITAGATGTVFTANTAIYARWTIETYKITYKLEGGTLLSANPEEYTVETATFKLNNPTKAGSAFVGWTEANNDNLDTAVTIWKGSTGHKSYTANWISVGQTTYTLTVESNPTYGGTARIDDGGGSVNVKANITAGTRIGISATTSTGYTFDKWTITSGEGEIIRGNNAYAVVGVNGNVTVRANFMQTGRVLGEMLEHKGKKYSTVIIDGKRWMAENMNYDTANGTGSWCYDNSVDNCTKYGRLYDWYTAIKVCPTGWHLPDTADWNKLVTAVGGADVAGKKLKSKNGWNNHPDDGSSGNGTDDVGFSALPGGNHYYYRDYSIGDFGGAGNVGYWWTATVYGVYRARFQFMSYDIDFAYDDFPDSDKELGYSVRCVQN